MIARSYGHDTLVGHFLILAALFFLLRKDPFNRKAAWTLLLSVASLVHAYFTCYGVY